MHGFQNIHCNADSNTYILPYIFIPKVQIIIFFYIALILLQLIMAYVPTFCYKNSSKYYGIAVKNDKKRGSKQESCEIE